MSDLVRVKLESGAEVTVSREVAGIHQLKVLDSPAVDNRGVALDAKPVRTVDEAADAADNRTPAQKAAATRAAKKAEADAAAQLEADQAAAREQAQAEADAANEAATQDPSSPTGEGASTEETR